MSDVLGQPRSGTVARTQRVSTRLGVVVVHDIVELIVTGELAPGASLPVESVLCEEFGVSRTVVRESIKRIEEKGLLRVEQGRRGTTVAPVSQWNLADPIVLSCLIEHDDSFGILDDVVFVRAALESDMSYLAASRATESDVAELRDALEQMRLASDDPQAFAELDATFHDVIMNSSRVRIAPSISRSLVGHALQSDRYRGIPVSDAVEATLAEHDLIAQAIAAGDAEGARQAMRAHIEVAWARRRMPTAHQAVSSADLKSSPVAN
jgi:GntR family galactonate operon transcriptional repressor